MDKKCLVMAGLALLENCLMDAHYFSQKDEKENGTYKHARRYGKVVRRLGNCLDFYHER